MSSVSDRVQNGPVTSRLFFSEFKEWMLFKAGTMGELAVQQFSSGENPLIAVQMPMQEVADSTSIRLDVAVI